jgi:hypothetical protein
MAVLTTLIAAIGHPHPLFSFPSNHLSRHTRFFRASDVSFVRRHSCAYRRASFRSAVSPARPLPADQKRAFCSCVPTAPDAWPQCPAARPSRTARGVKLFRCLFSAVVSDHLPSVVCINPSCILAPPAICGRFLRQQKSSVPPQGRSPQFFCVTPRPLLADRRHRPRG